MATGVFLILAAKAPAAVWKVRRSASGVITNIEKKREYVCHYSFHIMDPAFGHLTIKMSGHPPFGAQVILNGHEYVAIAAQGEGIGFTKEGNCFTEIADPQRLARVVDAWPQQAAIGRLGQVCDRWIYSACLCFGLDLAEQERSGFGYAYSVYQAEYSRNLLLGPARRWRSCLTGCWTGPGPGWTSRRCGPCSASRRGPTTTASGPAAQEIVIEKPQYGLAWFRIRFGRLQLKAYTKGEHVLRFEATVHNTKELRCRRSLENFAQIITLLAGMTGRFATTLDCADTGFLPDGVLDELPLPAQTGTGRIAGADLNKPRIRAALSAALALAPAPGGFTVAEHAARVRAITGHDGYTTRQAAYDLRKLRGKQLIDKPGRTRRYHVPPDGARTITALLTLRDHVIAPILAGARSPRMGRKPKIWTAVDRDYENLRIGMQTLFRHVGIETSRSRIDNILSIGECKQSENASS